MDENFQYTTIVTLYSMLETDEQFKDRICDHLPEGAWYTAEDLGEASGHEIDLIAEDYGLVRGLLVDRWSVTFTIQQEQIGPYGAGESSECQMPWMPPRSLDNTCFSVKCTHPVIFDSSPMTCGVCGQDL